MTTEQTQDQPETRPSEVRSDALLGCPFCGGTAALSKNYDGWWHVYCNNCHCKTETYGLPEGPTDAWNRRHARECGYCGHDHNDDDCTYANEPEYKDFTVTHWMRVCKPNDQADRPAKAGERMDEELAKRLEAYEWSNVVDGVEHCPCCSADRETGHSAWCSLYAPNQT